jgi:hypothetical protein
MYFSSLFFFLLFIFESDSAARCTFGSIERINFVTSERDQGPTVTCTGMASFKPNRSLLNPKFEGYRLDPIAQEHVVTRHPLQFKLSQATVSARSPLSVQEVQSRITHNHLAVAPGGHPRAMYVDAELKVIVVDVHLVSFLP